ncbi:MAG: hypothetical protein HC819_04405 [Cyclobacteriaceae bacterium]|nr:hypothetical protein [Cyclobacteriaceae bacterium]
MSDQGKISKGENYHGLPYQMLDFPAIFSKESIFAFRTMFWWGNFFSVTLHLQGEALKKYRKNICAHINELSSEGFFVSTGPTPWEYHYESENYKLIDIEDVARLAQENFIKLSKKIELENWAQLPFFAASQFQMLMQLAIS